MLLSSINLTKNINEPHKIVTNIEIVNTYHFTI